MHTYIILWFCISTSLLQKASAQSTIPDCEPITWLMPRLMTPSAIRVVEADLDCAYPANDGTYRLLRKRTCPSTALALIPIIV